MLRRLVDDAEDLGLIHCDSAVVISTSVHLESDPRRLPLLCLHQATKIEELLGICILGKQRRADWIPGLAVLLGSKNGEAHRAESTSECQREAVQVLQGYWLLEFEAEEVEGRGRVAVRRQVVRGPTGFGGSVEHVLGIFARA